MADPTPNRRNTSPYEFLLGLARRHRPRHGFDGEFARWKDAALPEVLATLGQDLPVVEPRPQLVASWEQGPLTWQRWMIDVVEGLSAVAYVNRPTDLDTGRQHPGLLCWHGHNRSGKEAVMGNHSSPELRGTIDASGTNYGERMAESGFVTFAIDWMGRGDLDDNRKPNHRGLAGDRDWCNLYYLNTTMLGFTPLGLNLAFGRALVRFAASLPYVDPDRIGVMGESGGGTMTLWSALTDDRLKAAEVICYSDLFADFGFRDLNYCGSQITPGLFQLVDLPDLQGLLAPLPLLVDIGAFDECFRVESAMACHERVREIYAAAGARDRLQLDLAPRGHGWAGNKSVDFFTEHLGGRDGRPASRG